MKLIHLSDLHLGKRVNGFSMVEDQIFILREILKIIDSTQPDGVLIAGDVYDKSVPSAEAVQLLDDFLVRLAERKMPVFLISGNHDSAQRMAFGSRLMSQSGIFLSPVYQGKIEPISLEDDYGKVNIYMLPFIKPIHVNTVNPEAEVSTYTEAVAEVIRQMAIDSSQRNVLMAHQFVTGGERSDSEDLSVGGSDNVDASVFADFDYVALGHLHRPQNLNGGQLRYSGTPLKYSFSEAEHEKSVTLVTLNEKGSREITAIPLHPKRDLRKITGTYEALTDRRHYLDTNTADYLHITLTDENPILDVMNKLRVIYPNIMVLTYQNRRTSGKEEDFEENERVSHSPLTLFKDLYEKQNNQPMAGEALVFSEALMEKIWEGED